MTATPLIVSTERGLYCPAGDFYVDAWSGVPKNIVTHAHSDHARRGSARYLTALDGVHVLRHRMGSDSTIDTLEYGQSLQINGVTVSLHPAGHVLGSAQVRIEQGGQICVITGDYKRQSDPTCKPFEVVPCHTLVTECTFGLPIFRWLDPPAVFADINQWWRDNVAHGRTSLLLAYSLGKAQRLLASIDSSIGPILLHGAVQAMVEEYRRSGIVLPPTAHASVENAKAHRGKALVICPPSAVQGSWPRKFAPASIAIASGWMQVRGFRRRGGIDRGFVVSDHVDWPALLQTIQESGAEHVIVTHGYTQQMQRYLADQGRSVSIFQTRFTDSGEAEEPAEEIA